MLAVDTNILVYAHRREAREHAVASELLRRIAQGAEAWAIPWPCLYEFFSVVTNPRIWKDAATSPEQATAQIDAWAPRPLSGSSGRPKIFWLLLRDPLGRPWVRGLMVHDARIAVICLAHGVEALLTRDCDFSLFPELPLRNPL